jgi:SAM-dependent methyltransferase
MKKPDKDAIFASHLAENSAYHARMLSDVQRNRGLRRAIESYVSESTRFLDVGSGTGIWAILAAKLGARRVVAIEIEECLIPLISKHAQENGVADKIEIVHGNVDDVKLDEQFDVIVSELFGRDVYGETTTRSFISIRDRFLDPGGVIIPQWMKMYAAPLIKRDDGENDNEIPITTDFLDGLRLNYGKITTMEDRADLKFAADPKLLTGVDYMTIDKPLAIEPLSAEWDVANLSQIDSFIVFSVSQFAPGIELNSMESKTWVLERYDFQPFEQAGGTIRFTITMDPKHPTWTISLPSHPSSQTQTYSPVFAFTRAKMAQAMTSYKTFRRGKPQTKS